MKLISYWRRIAIVLTGLGAGLAALAGAASAATTMFPDDQTVGAASPATPVVVPAACPAGRSR